MYLCSTMSGYSIQRVRCLSAQDPIERLHYSLEGIVVANSFSESFVSNAYLTFFQFLEGSKPPIPSFFGVMEHFDYLIPITVEIEGGTYLLELV